MQTFSKISIAVLIGMIVGGMYYIWTSPSDIAYNNHQCELMGHGQDPTCIRK